MGHRIVVTGSEGFIGRHLVRELKHRGHNVNRIDKRLPFSSIDMLDIEHLRQVITSINPDIIYHLAAITQVVDGYENSRKCLENNIMAVTNLLEVTRNMPVKIVHFSTDKVYGHNENAKETDALLGEYPYEISKICCEKIISLYIKQFNSQVMTLRPCNVYGSGDQNVQRIVPCILNSLKTGKPLSLRGSGKEKRDYIYVKDIVELAISIPFANGEVYNISTKENLSPIDVANIFMKQTGKQFPIEVQNTSKCEIKDQGIDNAKLLKVMQNWTPAKMQDVAKLIYDDYASSDK